MGDSKRLLIEGKRQDDRDRYYKRNECLVMRGDHDNQADR